MTTPTPESTTDLTTTRTYLRVRPTTDPIHPIQVAQALRKHHALPSQDEGGLFSNPTRPTLEMLLVTPANSQRVEYLFGIENATLDALERILDVLFPNDYETTQTSTNLESALTGESAATEPDGDAAHSLADRDVAGLELQAQADQPGDWRTRLTEFAEFHQPDATDTATWPLGSVLSALVATDTPVVVQTLLEPKPDWSSERDQTVYKLRKNQGTSLVTAVQNATDERKPQDRPDFDQNDLPPGVQQRIEELEAVDPRRSFTINTRAIAVDTESGFDPAATLADLGDAFTAVGHTSYQLTTTHHGTDTEATDQLLDDLITRRIRTTNPHATIPASVPWLGPRLHTTRPGIVADPDTAGSFVAVGGASLPESARRAIHTKSPDSVPRPLPPEGVLDEYRTEGLELGPPVTTDGTDSGPAIALEPTLQRRHTGLVGQTGSGKSMFAIRGLVSNHGATDGATIIFEPKDGVFADDYLDSHYAVYGDLETVYRFNAHEYLPAAPIFDIEPAMASGLSRTQAVAAVTNRLEAMLKGVMGAENYEDAKISSRVIRAVTKSLFDPVHGSTQCTLIDIQEVLARMERTGSAPPVASDRLRRTLSSIVDNSADTFTEIIGAAVRRLDTLANQEQLAPQFMYAPADPAADVERFDWREKLDENCVIILDTSALENEPQRVLTLLTLSQLWTALRRRRRREQREADRRDDLPHVNIHVEEAADIATSGALDEMLSKGRAYGVAVSLSMQFLGQLEDVDRQAYKEAINNTATVIAGQTNRDRALAERLATTEVPREQVAARLRSLDPGEWLCSLPATFDTEKPHPFTISSGPLPAGHPDGPEPLTEAQEVTVDAARAKVEYRSRAQGLPVNDEDQPATASGAAATTAASAHDPTAGRPTLDTTGPFTNVVPDGVTFNANRNAWTCTTCETAHGTSLKRLLAAVDCHGDRAELSRDEVPTVAVECTVTRSERLESRYDPEQFVFMQLLYNAWQGAYDPEWEFDIVWDDMDDLVAYAGLEGEQLTELLTTGAVVEDTTTPQTIYSLTPAGRTAIQAAHREGTAHGDGHGDLSESNFHRMLVETMVRAFRQQYVDDPEHPGVEVRPYYGVDDGRLDVAVLDAEGEVVVAGEAERSNHDIRRAVPDDFDKMAACDPDHAIWVVPNRPTGHDVIAALHNPPDNDPRVSKIYDTKTHLSNVTIETDGLTDISAIGPFRKRHLSRPE